MMMFRMKKADGDVVFESDLNSFDIKPIENLRCFSPFIEKPDEPIGIYRVIYKNGLPLYSFIEPIAP